MTGRRYECAGCLDPIHPDTPHVVCSFHSRGFPLARKDIGAYPCGSAYHCACVRAGSPFTSRRKHQAGLILPALSVWPEFICELCTVRSVLGRELGHPGDRWLLQLERVRLLDLAHSWASGTTRQYQSKLRGILRFQANHPGLSVLPKTVLFSPPHGADIGLMWMELHASVQPIRSGRGRRQNATPVITTVRAYRSAASQYHSWHLLSTQSGDHFHLDRGVLHRTPVRVTDGAPYTLFSRGFQARLGTESVPSTALLGRHVRRLDSWFDSHYQGTQSAILRAPWALAGFANLLLWLSWVRGGELFSLEWGDLTCIWPHQGPSHDLPPGTGALLLRLLPETKGSRSKTADVVVALETVTGLNIGRWARRCLSLHHDSPPGSSRIFQVPGGPAWTSHSYRQDYLYPGLLYLQAGGDPFLKAFTGEPGNSIPHKFYSLHSYRRGARSHCKRSQRVPGHRKATESQIYEHARWTRKRGSEPIGTQYDEWTLYERLRITLLCH